MKKPKDRTVWSDDEGDLRKTGEAEPGGDGQVHEKDLVLQLRRLTSGKGRPVIEITGLPDHKTWSQTLAKRLKKSLGVGGTFKRQRIELHGEVIEKVMAFLDKQTIKWKKTGG